MILITNHLSLCCPLLLLPSVFHSIRIFSSESALCIKWLKYWSFSFNISPSNEYSGLISFKVDRFDFLVVQGTQESSPTPQFESFHSSALSLLRGPILTFIHDKCKKHSCDYTDIFLVFNKIISLLSNTRSKFVIGFLPRSKNPLISSLKSLSRVILESKKTNCVTASTFPLLFDKKWWDWMPWS